MPNRETVGEQENQPQGSRLLTAQEAVKYMNVDSPRSLRNLRNKGLLKSVKPGRRVSYLQSDLDDCIQKLRDQSKR